MNFHNCYKCCIPTTCVLDCFLLLEDIIIPSIYIHVLCSRTFYPFIVFTYQHLAVPPVSMFDFYYVKYMIQRCLILIITKTFSQHTCISMPIQEAYN